MNIYRFFFILAIAVAISSCDEDVVIGEDLLDGERINTHVKSDYTLKAKTVVGDPVYPFRKGKSRRTFTIGEVNDPIFGRYSSDLYLSLRHPRLPKYNNATLDSIVLVMAYDTLGNYGDQNATQHLIVSRVVDDFAFRDSISSDEKLNTSSILGELSFVPRPEDSLTITNRKNPSKTVKIAPQIRIRLSDALGKELMADSAAAKSDTVLLQTLKGLAVTARSEGKSMLGINMTATTINALQLYYTKNDTLKEVFEYKFRTEAFAHTEEDISGSAVETYLNNDKKGEQYVFLQGFKGVDSEFSLPNLDSLKGKIINKATLILSVAKLPQDFSESDFPSNRQLLAYDTSDGKKTLVDDLTTVSFSTALQVFGGARTEENDIITYTLDITEYIRKQITDNIDNPKLRISVLNREQSPRNTVFFGTNNGQKSAQLTISYTDL